MNYYVEERYYNSGRGDLVLVATNHALATEESNKLCDVYRVLYCTLKEARDDIRENYQRMIDAGCIPPTVPLEPFLRVVRVR